IAVIISGSVYETGGRTVTRVLKRTLWPGTALVGVRPLFDTSDGASPNANAGFEILRVDANGKRVPAKGLKVSMIRERRDYRWIWGDHGWDYDFTPHFDNVASKTLDLGVTSNGKVDFPVEWGNYRLDVLDPETGLTSRYPFTAGWSWDDQNRGLDARPDKVKLALDKTSYKAGDTLKVTVTPPQPGKGLLLVESDHLLQVMAIDAKAGSVFSIPVTAAWERHDVYVTALVFRGGSAAELTTPARAVGVAHVPMGRADRELKVKMAVAAKSLPERDLPVTISAPQLAGKQAYVTVSAVDVGILNITRFPVPDPFAYFFEPRRLAVDAYDVYGRIIESFEGNVAKLRYGGDMALGPLPQARRPTAHVQTVDLFAGPVAMNASGVAQVNVKLPEFNGTLRVSTVVFSADRYGKADTEVLVRAPVVVEVSAPRALAPGDSSTVTLDVQNFTGASHEFTVSAKADAPLKLDGATRKVTLKDGAKSTLSFPLSALPGNGVGHYSVTVVGDGGFKTERKYELAVRPAWPATVRSRSSVLDGLSPITLDTSDAVGMMADSVTARLTVSALPPLPFASALTGLLDYPYGCAEQTTSKGYAALVLDAVTAKKLGVTGLGDIERKRRVEGALGRLTSMQLPNGHFSMWGGDTEAVSQLTPYITEFLLDARDAGFQVPDAVLQKSLERLNEDLLTGGERFYSYEHADTMRFNTNAYSGYVLARVNRAPLGTLRALYDNDRKKALTPLPMMHLGVALNLMGDHARGNKAVAEAFAMKSKRPWYLGDYGSDLRDLAMMVTLSHRFKLAKPEYDARILDLARETKSKVDESKNSRWSWLSTQEKIAIGALGKALITDSDAQVSGTLSAAGSEQSIPPATIWSRDFDVVALRGGVRFTPEGKPPLYGLIDVAGVPSSMPSPDDSKISVVRSYYTTDGELWKGGALKEGDALIVGLEIEAKEAVPDALIVDLLPAGVEIENFNLGDAKQWADIVIDEITLTDRSSAADVQHEEFRDDRYVAALKLERGSKAHVFYLVRAVTPGTYGVPPPMVQDMYRPQIRGIGKSIPATIKVVQP
ncbi:MAG: alpha-2-macroglobulin, partial [Lysobacteraceae bacterium]